MKTILPLVLCAALVLAAGCSERSKEAEKKKQESAAKAHADAAKKEMQTLPEVFSTPEYYKKSAPANNAPTETKTDSVKK